MPEAPRDASRDAFVAAVRSGTPIQPPDYQILRHDEQGLDEVLVNHCSIHIERMSAESFWIGITRSDGRMLHVNIGAKRARVDATVQEDELNCVSSTMGQPGYGHE